MKRKIVKLNKYDTDLDLPLTPNSANNKYDVILFIYFQYRSLAPMYYRGAAAAIVVYDVSRDVSLIH